MNVTIFKHYFNRTFFGKSDILFAIALPLAITHIMFFVNYQDEAVEVFAYAGSLAGFISLQLAFMFTFSTAQAIIVFLYQDLKSQGVRDRLLVAPQTKNKYIVNLFLAVLSFTLFTTGINLLIPVFTIGASYDNNLLISLVTLILLSCIGIMFNVFAFYISSTQKTATMISSVAMFVFMGMSGVRDVQLPRVITIIFDHSPLMLGINAVMQENVTYILYLIVWVVVLSVISFLFGKRREI